MKRIGFGKSSRIKGSFTDTVDGKHFASWKLASKKSKRLSGYEVGVEPKIRCEPHETDMLGERKGEERRGVGTH